MLILPPSRGTLSLFTVSIVDQYELVTVFNYAIYSATEILSYMLKINNTDAINYEKLSNFFT